MVGLTTNNRRGNADLYSSNGRKSPRKQWSFQGEPQNLLKQLRSQLADDGCPDSQYLLAKTFLEDETDSNYVENSCKAVMWLIQATNQGSDEAYQLLKKCFEEGKGISDQTYNSAKKCLEGSDERPLRIAVEKLFRNISNGNDFVSVSNFERKLLNFDSENYENQHIEFASQLSNRERKMCLERRYGGERLTKSAIFYSSLAVVNGELPLIYLNTSNLYEYQKLLVDSLPTVDKGNEEILSNDREVQKPLVHIPKPLFLPDKILSFMSEFLSVLDAYPQIANAFFCLTFLIAVFMRNFFFLLIPNVCAFILAPLILIYFSQINAKEWRSFINDIWLKSLYSASDLIDVKVCEKKFKFKFLKDYLKFFLCLFVFFCSFNFIHFSVKSLLLVPLCVFSVFAVVFLTHKNLYFSLAGVFIYCAWQFSLNINYLSDIEDYVLKCSSLENFSNLCNGNFRIALNLRFMSLMMLWTLNIFVLAMRNGFFAAMYHVACISLCYLTVRIGTDVELYYIYASVLFWIITLCVYKFWHYISFILPVLFFNVVYFLKTENSLYFFVVFITASIAVLLSLKLLDEKLFSLLKLVLIGLSISLMFSSANELDTASSLPSDFSLNWNHYDEICASKVIENNPKNQVNCLKFWGTNVNWTGQIKSLDVSSVSNFPESLLSFLPSSLQPKVKCLNTEINSECKKESFNLDIEYKHCLTLQITDVDRCSLHRWNRYNFNIKLSMSDNFWGVSTNDLKLSLNHDFLDIFLKLSVDDKINFVGSLEYNPNAVVLVKNLTCVSCFKSVPIKLPSSKIQVLNEFSSIFNYIDVIGR